MNNMPRLVLEASKQFDNFVRNAQTYQYSEAPIKKELDKAVGKKVEDIAAKYLSNNGGAASSMEIRINYQSPTVCSFVVDVNYIGNINAKQDARDKEEKELEAKIAAELNTLSPTVVKIMAKYQKDKPLDYKYVSYE